MTAGKLAKKADMAESTISRWRTGKNKPTFEAVQALAGALGVEIYELFLPDNRPSPKASVRGVVGSDLDLAEAVLSGEDRRLAGQLSDLIRLFAVVYESELTLQKADALQAGSRSEIAKRGE